MSKWVLAALAALIIAVGAMTWVGVRANAPGPTVANKIADPSAAPPPTPRAPVSPTAAEDREPVAPAASDDPAEKHTQQEIDHEAVERFVGDAVVRELYHKAASCYRGQTGNGGLEVQYGLRVADGTASIYGATMRSSELGDRELEDCVVAAIADHTWQVSDGFTIDEPRETATFTIPGLRKLSRADDDDSQ